MLKKIKNIIMAAVLPIAFAAPVAIAAPVAVYADAVPACASNVNSSLNAGINAATGTSGCGQGTDSQDPQKIAKEAVNLLSMIVGIASVIMIIVGGFKYITSGGDSNKVGSAKNTLIYAIIGLVIVALAQAIVHFVLKSVASSAS